MVVVLPFQTEKKTVSYATISRNGDNVSRINNHRDLSTAPVQYYAAGLECTHSCREYYKN